MLLNKSTEHAIRLVLYLTRFQNGNFRRIREIAEECGVSYFQLGKVAQSLIKAGILESYTGPHGGVRLTKGRSETRLYDILEAVEGTDIFERCVLGFQECGDVNPCPVHDHWKKARSVISQLFKERTVEEFVDEEFVEFDSRVFSPKH
ncbi:MAG: Rrf2 family transcriptional regulator [Candidatus Neomarinimicrobiota bacterium]